MTLSMDMEILKSIAIARHAEAQYRFYNTRTRKLYCPVCGDVCPVFQDMLNRRNILYCRACQSDYIVQIREHQSLTDGHQNEVKLGSVHILPRLGMGSDNGESNQPPGTEERQ